MNYIIKNKLDTVQVLRFLAAFSVMMVHIPLLGFGIWGVDIFFIISGFIMMYVTEINDKNFLIRRIIRIVPLYWILTFGVFLIALIKPEFLNNTTANFEHLFKSLFFIPFNKNDIGHYPILFLGWTLNFEIVFYILFSLSLVFFKKNKFIFSSIIIIFFVSINSLLAEKNFIFSTYCSHMFFEFILGMAAYKIWRRFEKKIPISVTNNVSFLLGFILLTFLMNYLNLSRIFAFGVPSFFLLLYFLFFLNHLKFPRILILLGDASYCIYLIHPYLIQFFYKVMNIGKFNFFIQSLLTIFISIIVLIISILIFKLVELPINKYFKRKLVS